MNGFMHTYFLGLTAVGFDSLWGSMLRNGTAQAIGAAKASGVLPSGGLLRCIYTAIPALDTFLLSPVIFYDALTHDKNPVYRSLLVSLFSTMQTTSFCMIVNGFHGGKSSWWAVLESLFWGVFNQSYGAAFVYPVYFLTHLHQITEDPAEEVSIEDAEALFDTSIIAAVLPLWLLYPTFFSCSSETRQILIASYRATPAVLALAQPLIAGMIRRFRPTPLPSSWSRPLVKASLFLSGACAALGHLYAVGSSLTSPGVTLQNIFWPWATLVDRSSSQVIAQGCHLFLQNDWLVISAAAVPYAAAILSSARRSPAVGKDGQDGGQNGADGSWQAWAENKLRGLEGRLVTLTAMTVAFSPGAVLAWAMAT